MRPKFQILNKSHIDTIIDQAIHLLCSTGIEIQNPIVLKLLKNSGLNVSKNNSNVIFNQRIIEEVLKSAPSSFKLFDVSENEATYFKDTKVHFTPGSSALNLYDINDATIRKPDRFDYITYVKIADQLKNIASQSTAFIPSDVDSRIADLYRLFLSLLYGRKPVVTGVFTIDSFPVMLDFQKIIRGSGDLLRRKPLTIFTCCATSPLKWGLTSSQNLIDCARAGIPVEIIAMPLCGFSSPVTLTGTLIQHCAEVLSGLVIHQTACPGAPVLYGASLTIFNMRNGTTPMGAIESMMLSCGANEIGKLLGLPTQAYISLSDAKHLDAQAGLETGMGAVLAALSGINNISGPGMMEFENCFSIEKLIVDNEIAGMAKRLIEGITLHDDLPMTDVFMELINDQHLIISDHTQKYLHDEHLFTGAIINRDTSAQWEAKGKPELRDNTRSEVEKLLKTYNPDFLANETRKDLIDRINDHTRLLSIELPEIPDFH